MDPVIVSLGDLQNGISDELLTQAFGTDSLGIIIVKDLPEEFTRLRSNVLKSINTLAKLPKNELEKLENPQSLWLTGWSLGKEKLANGKYDFNKGSYYVNCAFHNNSNLEGPSKELINRFPNYPTYTHPNIWPSNINNFEVQVKALCNLIIDVAEHVAVNCDRYISKIHPTYEAGFLNRIVKESTCTKARLLHYYPVTNDPDWCGEHLDHSCLTGLTSSLYLDELNAEVESDGGLFIKNRNNEVVKVSIPKDCLAFQSGSALEDISRGKFRAVPHFVKGTSLPNVSRNTLAVFCQPNLDEPINNEENFAQYSDRILKQNHQ